MQRNVTTLQARCSLAAGYVRDYISNPYGFWIALGKTSPWPNEDEPPFAAVSSDRVPELYGFVYVHLCTSVFADSAGEIQTQTQNYSVVKSINPQVLSSAKANKVYLEAVIPASELPPAFTYRVKGLCTELEFINPPTILGEGTFIPAADVLDYFLDWVSVHTPVINDGVTQQVIQIVREF